MNIKMRGLGLLLSAYIPRFPLLFRCGRVHCYAVHPSQINWVSFSAPSLFSSPRRNEYDAGGWSVWEPSKRAIKRRAGVWPWLQQSSISHNSNCQKRCMYLTQLKRKPLMQRHLTQLAGPQNGMPDKHKTTSNRSQ